MPDSGLHDAGWPQAGRFMDLPLLLQCFCYTPSLSSLNYMSLRPSMFLLSRKASPGI
jgi:hypothetical protein